MFDGADHDSLLSLATWARAVDLYRITAIPQLDGYGVLATEQVVIHQLPVC